jgi:hypothetical protein
VTYILDQTPSDDFEDIVAEIITALGSESFGVRCKSDVPAMFTQKLDEEVCQYRILGPCNAEQTALFNR